MPEPFLRYSRTELYLFLGPTRIQIKTFRSEIETAEEVRLNSDCSGYIPQTVHFETSHSRLSEPYSNVDYFFWEIRLILQ